MSEEIEPEAMALDVLLVAAMRGDIQRNPEASLEELAAMQGIASCCDKCGRSGYVSVGPGLAVYCDCEYGKDRYWREQILSCDFDNS